MNTNLCQACNSTRLKIIYRVEKVPTHSVSLLSTPEQARSHPTGDIHLGYCQSCGFISNLAFNPDLQDYAADYESTQSYSATFGDFSRQLSTDLVNRHNLRGKAILEIGCGNGEFLVALCETGDNRGIGFDPAHVAGRVLTTKDVTFIDEFYSEKYIHHQADFLVCKMTLEHIPVVAEFVGMVAVALKDAPDTIVFFQVPDVTRILEEMAFWDIYYEHCSYFSPVSLVRLFQHCGFSILDVRRAYDNQYLMIEATLTDPRPDIKLEPGDDLHAFETKVSEFAAGITLYLAAWREFLNGFITQDQKIVLWGAGSKAVAFLTTLDLKTEIEYCVDINPHKHGTFMAGTGQEIVAPADLQVYQPDLVIAMNPIYKTEIQTALDQLKVAAQIITITDIPHD
jgi:2-polyprenyl-3-methyl-5-hydroxy-6-metoxy-1,4-benzoquinol methylase